MVCLTGSGACSGLLLGGRMGALVGASLAGLGAGIGLFLYRRRALASFEAVTVDGHAEGIADMVLLSIALYQAAVFPLTPGGVSDEEHQARRTVAYQLAAYDGLPHAVRLSAASALETLDEGLDAERARAAMQSALPHGLRVPRRSLTHAATP